MREKNIKFISIFSLSRYTVVSKFTGSVNSVFAKVVVFMHICEIEKLWVVNSSISYFSLWIVFLRETAVYGISGKKK
jgi:hypothetical protein